MKIVKALQKAALITSTTLFGLLMTATNVTFANADTISAALNQPNAKVEKVGDKKYTAEELEYFKSGYNSIKEVVYNGFRLQEQEQAEGTVLLTNKNNALPLAKGSKLSVFGVTGAVPFYGASGSGGINTSEAIGWYDAFNGYEHSNPEAPKEKVQHERFAVNPSLSAKYTTWSRDAAYKPSSSASKVNIGDVPWDVVSADTDAMSEVETYGDAAVFIIKRTGGEGYDLPATSGANEQYNNVNNKTISVNDGTYGDYLQLSETEKSVLDGLKALKAQNKIKKIVLILNMASTIQLDFLKADTYDIDACMWAGSVGEVGTVAVAKLMSGEYNFSAGASSTLWKDNLKNPVNNNFMDQNYFFTYSNYEQFGFMNPALENQYQSTFTTYTVYQEGVYLGYKYTETRYEDYVMGKGKVGAYQYNDVVAYPFGYGLSYTTFDFSDLSVSKSGKTYTVSVKVSNTGSVAGKTPVQVYVAKPYGDYAKNNNMQVASVELIDFGKTEELAPGASETVKIEVNEKYFASFDTFGKGTYITMDGDYSLIVAKNAHEAVNNLLASKGKTPANTDGRMDANGNSDLVKSFHYGLDSASFSMSEKTQNPIKASFDFIDINTYAGKGSNSVKYYSRDDWAGTVVLPERKADGTLIKHNATLTLTQQMADDMRDQMDYTKVMKKGGEYPTYGAKNGLSLIDLMEVSYENTLWDDLLDQMTWDETVDLLSNGRHKTNPIESVNKPSTGDENGPNGFSQKYQVKKNGSNYSGPTHPYAERAGGFDEEGNYIADPDIANGYTTTGFSSNGVLAATFNKELAKKIGEQIGEEGLWAGQAGLLGLGMNIIRTPYAGRTAEYYSECSMLTGLICVPEIQGCESKGIHTFIKHCALNECETARHGVCEWITEQAFRETYLRAFEMGIEDGGSYNVMTAFNRIGCEAVANSATFTKVFLRNECGLPGIVETDCAGDMTDGKHGEAYVSRMCNVYTGASDLNEYNYGVDVPDYTGGTLKFADLAPGNDYGNMGQAMREACKRILYATLHSNAMNGYSADTKIVRITPTWQKLIIGGDIASGVLLGGSVAWVAVSFVLNLRKGLPIG